ncbi:MGMT family protein [Pseudochryseolinea flava]|uniref:Cysteine methyltransferase n=1 Tax=Pseudochryseolinea flava TaxID=2059302 RepID=A0A364Y8Z2_9BACT|nr:MGMT family protein [Pseudochryseolinea flava]RAW02839.1 cysteine methyltransferase [Pseudochryseolinea flava]
MPPIKKKPGDYNFFDDVYAVVRLIPSGRVTSYGAIAHYLGLKSSARMVGWAMHGCPKDVPAHRVVNSAGLLTGKHHFKPPSKMAELLKKEKLVVVNDKIVRFKEVFWNPSEELSLNEKKRAKKRPKSGEGQ